MKAQKVFAMALVAIGMSTAAQADGVGVAAKVSTLGYGVEVGYRVNSYLGVRAGINRGTYDYTETDAGIDYNYGLELDNIPVVIDWHVFGGVFRVTGGVVNNNNQLTGRASGLLDIGSGTYNTTVTTDIAFKKSSPYVGIGWGSLPSSTKGIGFSFDVGVMAHGSPTATITAPLASAADIAAEEAALNSELKDSKYWPVISMGLGYTF